MTSVARELPTAPAAPAPASLTARQARSRRRRLGRGLLYVVAVLMALWVLLPIYLITVPAFSPRDVVYEYPLVPRAVSTETMDFFVNSTGVLESLRRSVYVALIAL